MRRILLATLLAAALGLGSLAQPALAGFSLSIDISEAPPPPRVEEPHAHRPGWVWVPGCWRWTGQRHVWTDGFWVKTRPGRHFTPAHWERRGEAHHFEPGRWEPDRQPSWSREGWAHEGRNRDGRGQRENGRQERRWR